MFFPIYPLTYWVGVIESGRKDETMTKKKAQSTVNATETSKRSRKRSPNYPILNLEDAIARAKALYDKDGTHPMRIQAAHERWEYKPLSSQADQTTAALKSYGLLEVEGAGDKRRVRVSSTGERILREAPDQDTLRREAALRPLIHKELWEKYSENGLPSDKNIQDYLEWEREGGTFNKDVVESVVNRFRQTIDFAGLAKTDIMGSGAEENGDKGDEDDQALAHRPPADKEKPMVSEGQIPVPVLMSNGNVTIVSIPKMTKQAFEFFKNQIELFKAAIVVESKQEIESPNSE
jgi:hypothetical protein